MDMAGANGGASFQWDGHWQLAAEAPPHASVPNPTTAISAWRPVAAGSLTGITVAVARAIQGPGPPLHVR